MTITVFDVKLLTTLKMFAIKMILGEKGNFQKVILQKVNLPNCQPIHKMTKRLCLLFWQYEQVDLDVVVCIRCNYVPMKQNCLT